MALGLKYLNMGRFGHESKYIVTNCMKCKNYRFHIGDVESNECVRDFTEKELRYLVFKDEEWDEFTVDCFSGTVSKADLSDEPINVDIGIVQNVFCQSIYQNFGPFLYEGIELHGKTIVINGCVIPPIIPGPGYDFLNQNQNQNDNGDYVYASLKRGCQLQIYNNGKFVRNLTEEELDLTVCRFLGGHVYQIEFKPIMEKYASMIPQEDDNLLVRSIEDFARSAMYSEEESEFRGVLIEGNRVIIKRIVYLD